MDGYYRRKAQCIAECAAIYMRIHGVTSLSRIHYMTTVPFFHPEVHQHASHPYPRCSGGMRIGYYIHRLLKLPELTSVSDGSMVAAVAVASSKDKSVMGRPDAALYRYLAHYLKESKML